MQKLGALCLTILLFAACSKNTSIEVNTGNNNNNGGNTGGNIGGNTGGNTNTNYYIKFSLDGTAKNFDVQPQALMTNALGATILTFVAGSGAAGGLENINLIINSAPSDNLIGAGTYTQTDVLNYLVQGVYNPGSTSEVYAAGAVISSNPGNPLKIVISSIDGKTATGTFSGDFIYVNSTTQTVGPGKKVISNGSFYLPVVKM